MSCINLSEERDTGEMTEFSLTKCWGRDTYREATVVFPRDEVTMPGEQGVGGDQCLHLTKRDDRGPWPSRPSDAAGRR